MRSERAALAVFAALLSPAAASAPARAEAPAAANTARLEVDAAASCSTRDELVARVAARSTRIRFVQGAAGVPILAARIEPGARGAVIAELTVTEPDGRRFSRRIEAQSCAAATDALALVVAITLDPSAAGGDASAAAGGATTADADAAPVASSPPPPPPEPRSATDRPGGGDDTGEPGAPAVRRVSAAVAAQVVFGPAPDPMPGVAVEVAAALDRASIWSPALVLTLTHAWSGDVRENLGIAEFTLDAASLDACPARLAVSRLELRACAAGTLGRLAARGSNTFEPASVARPFGTGGGTLRLAVALGRVELRARLGAAATLWRDAFEFTPEVFHRVASVTLVGDVGLGVRFP